MTELSTSATDCAEFTLMCGWLLDPNPDTGIDLADEADGWQRRTYPELRTAAWRIAALLRERGVRPGDGVCVVLPTGFDCIASMYAVWACGATLSLVPPPVFGGGEEYVAHLRGILTQAVPRIVLTSGDIAETIKRATEVLTGTSDAMAGAADLLDGAADALDGVTEVLVLQGIPDCDGEPFERAPVPADDFALVQFTSGSLGTPRGVRISWRNLGANTSFITSAVDWRSGDVTVSWLPLYHDMGLIGGLLASVAKQGELRLMRPDQFVRDPGRWLRALAGAHHSVSPSFGMGYTAKRVQPAELEGLDLSGLRSLITGAEPIDIADVHAFTTLLADTGYSPESLRPAYGLAESTLMATISVADRVPTALRVDSSTLRFGAAVRVLATAVVDGGALPGAGWVVGLGCSTAESTITIVDTEGAPLPEGVLGEVVIAGPSVAQGYQPIPGEPDREGATRFIDGAVHSGDAGFLRDGRLYVLGRMGASIKVRGKPVFMEDVDHRVAHETGLAKHRFAAVAMQGTGADQGIVLFAEARPGDWIEVARKVLRGDLGPAQQLTIVTGRAGLIRRTSSGKPRRRLMWELYRGGELGDDVTVHGALRGSEVTAAGPRRPAQALLTDGEIADLLAAALAVVDIPADSTVLLEGSIAEGFGNTGSDIDFLVAVPGADPAPEMPTVLFLGGRRVEIRTRSRAQLEDQLAYARNALPQDDSDPTTLIDLNQDVLNRCQRFLRATVVRSGAVDVEEIRKQYPYADFAALMSAWWFARGQQSLRQAVAMAALEAWPEATGWARDGLLDAIKGWAANRGETYIESKWIGPQLDRIGENEVAQRYYSLLHRLTEDVTGPGMLDEVLEFVVTLGHPAVPNDPKMVRLSRIGGITSWPIDGRIHVLRADREVFVLSDGAAKAWRSVVFGRSLADVTAGAGASAHADLAEFTRLGLVGLSWRDAGALRPAVAMVKVIGAYTPPPTTAPVLVGLGGGARDADRSVTLSPLPAARFTECASALVWSNVIIENAREDLVGALEQRQGRVAEAATERLVRGVVRMLLSTNGCAPLPPDIAAVATLDRLLPQSADRAELIARVRAAQAVRFTELIESGAEYTGLATVDALVDIARGVADLTFPAAFDSHEQWRRTLTITYDWLRLAAYLNTELPIDEVQDLLASGGAQPHQRHRASEGEVNR
ncbi:AMP-binding protein [Nocardia sp. NPDC056000]|uniref:AMP-binding protein n=1 Tax=Nocardia sp. NPDC056000 TaxID=3345674 RepID=UPI0035D8C7BB